MNGAAVPRRSAVRHWQRIRLPIILLVVASATGCGGQSGESGAKCSNPLEKLVEERQVEVAYQGPLADSTALTAPAPRLIVQVTNTQPSVERTRLTIDGSDALDVDLPALMCNRHPPVFSFA